MTQHARVLPVESLFNEDLRTWANAVTVFRTVAGLALFSVAALEHSTRWNLAGLVIHAGLDVLDGYLARALDQETRFGAQLDILSDRILIAFFYLNCLAMHPEWAVVIALFLFEFMVLDHYLSNQFLRYPILSPNYFYVVDRRIWLLNWSVPGKFFNSGIVTILLLLTRSVWPVLPVLIVLFGIKIYSFVRLHRLPPAEH
jgi:CDP-diacylglycerol--glycerol-3-phosphate 3-phosphatidyltransferase